MTKILQGKISVDVLNDLINFLMQDGYIVIGPKVSEFSIKYEPIKDIHDLPKGYTTQQDNGIYRIESQCKKTYFGFNLASNSAKNYLFPPKQARYIINHDGTINKQVEKIPKYAFLGLRGCEVNAIKIQDKVLMTKPYQDWHYTMRRQQALIISINCATTVSTCFCVSMQAGPEVKQDADIVLTEICAKGEHYFICKSLSIKGNHYFQKLNVEPLSENDLLREAKIIDNTSRNMGRQMNIQNVQKTLYQNQTNEHWQKIAEQCINCGNCTAVCPTCFCTKTDYETDINRRSSTCSTTWDSCFSQEFSNVHGKPVRESAMARYRQWMTHKLAGWHDQFDTSGCVGCGKCIAWCPVGIDLTAEFKNITEKSDV